MAKQFFLFLIISCMGLAMDFAPMGNVSTSLGGVGVALRNSAWGLYYNPALLSSDPRSKFSFSIGFSLAKNDLNPLLELDYQNPSNSIASIFSSLKNPFIDVQTQMGVVAQIGGFYQKKNIAVADEYGRIVSQSIEKQMSAFAMGTFALSQTHLFVGSAGYYNYEVSSFSVALMEIPIGYAYKLETSFGDFNFGGALKYLRAVFDVNDYKGNIYNGIDIKLPNFLKMNPAHNVGIDLGFLYSIANFHLGLSAKNINFPAFKANGKKIKLDAGLRMGASYEFLKHYVVAMDVDLLPQKIASFKSQYLGFGVMGDYTFVDFRVGVGVDFLNINNSKLTAGFNLYGILDLVGEMGFNFVKARGSETAMPTNFGVKIGSTFAF